MRMHNWMIQARSTNQAGGGPPPGSVGKDTGGKAFHIQYGFGDGELMEFGSRFQEPSTAEIIRAYSPKKDAPQKMQLALPHKVRRRLRARVVRIEMAGIVAVEGGAGGLVAGFEGGRDMVRDMLLDNDGEDVETGSDALAPQYGTSTDIQQQLADAQWTIFDAELFQEVLREARTIAGVRMVENQAVLPIDERHELILEYLDADDADPSSTSPTGNPTSQTVNLALRLLLSRQHKHNLLHRRDRLLSSISSSAAAAVPVARPGGPRVTVGGPTGPGVGGAPPAAQAAMPTGILVPTLNWLKFWAMCERVRGVVETLVRPMCGVGGMEMRVHFEKLNGGRVADAVGAGPTLASLERETGWGGAIGEVGMVVVVGVVKGPSLRFTLRNPTTILAHLPQTTLTLTSLTEFKDLITREINLMSLRIVCDEANDVLRYKWRHQRRDTRTNVEEDRWLWRVDEVEERSFGSVMWWMGKEKSVRRKLRISNAHLERPISTLRLQIQPSRRPTKRVDQGRDHGGHVRHAERSGRAAQEEGPRRDLGRRSRFQGEGQGNDPQATRVVRDERDGVM
ncbi:subunit 17 of mediator complex-domain-containing protein [Jimgerdemannia flammicorona]|uniref:Mediator of RNA polymerase II transcription subunit 17 n=1 Tax=Jimgerdemannia flammicorona TaxID=994334 RepID=A0A433B9G8_9FUNG|nr:subunit 17 of mediator complex-domain-containing protein [Jimgerdemannia flammicorona]